MINEAQALSIVKKYCPSVKLTVQQREGKEGIYLTDTNEIIITKDWNIVGLLHEITHAVLYLEDKRIGHDAVFADRFTKIVAEVFKEE